jgi:hypothetical protein
MDQRIFAQLDQLQRGARETQPRRQEYGRHQATHTGYDEYDEYDQAPTQYGEEDVYGDENMIPLDVDGMEDWRPQIHQLLTERNRYHHSFIPQSTCWAAV